MSHRRCHYRRAAAPAAALVCLAWIGAAGFLGGCAASRGPGPDAADDRTGGVQLDFFVENEERTYSFYRVESEGTIGFGGGLNAYDRQTSWTGPLREDEIERLLALIDEHRWFEADPPSSGEPPGRSYTIKVSGPEGRRSFTVLGDEPGIVAVHELLDRASLRRLDRFLEELPKPGQQP